MALEDVILGMSEDQYGGDYRAHLLEVYLLYVEMADRISGRRQTANSFFLTINTGLVALVGYVQLGGPLGGPAVAPQAGALFFAPVALAGMVLCFLWYRLIRSYRDLNSAKFRVIHEIERRLPVRPYDAEWEAVGRGDRPALYLPFTHIEVAVPWVFFAIHLVVLVGGVFGRPLFQQ